MERVRIRKMCAGLPDEGLILVGRIIVLLDSATIRQTLWRGSEVPSCEFRVACCSGTRAPGCVRSQCFLLCRVPRWYNR